MKQMIESNNAPKAIGPYSPAVKLGDFVFLSGQIPLDPYTQELVGDDVTLQTHQVMRNIGALLEEMGLDYCHVVKTTIFVQNMSDFQAINEVYSQYFTAPYPARSTIEVAKLPKNALVEIECFVIDTLAYEQMSSCCCDKDCCDEDCTCGE